MRILPVLRFTFILGLALLPAIAFADSPWNREKVIIKDGVEGKYGEETIVFRMTDVQEVRYSKGDWLLVGSDTWVKRKNVFSLDEAIEYYTGKLKADATERDYLVRGNVWAAKHLYDQAIEDYSAAIKLAPKNATYYETRATLKDLSKKYDAAIEDYAEAIRLNPKKSVTYLKRGNTWFKQGNYDAALHDYNEAIQLDPKQAGVFINRAAVWIVKRQYDKASEDYSEAIRIEPKNSITYHRRGNTWFNQSNYDAALRDYNEAIELNPKQAGVFISRAEVWIAKRQYDKAIEDYSEAIRLDPKNIIAYYKRARLWSSQGEHEKAIKDFSKAIALNPNRKTEEYHSERGMDYYHLGKYEKALEDFSQAVELIPGNHYAYNQRAWFQATCPDARYRDGKQAVLDAQKSCELSQWSHWETISTLAEAYAEAGDFENAVKWQKKVIELETNNEWPDKHQRLKLYESGKPFRESAVEQE